MSTSHHTTFASAGVRITIVLAMLLGSMALAVHSPTEAGASIEGTIVNGDRAELGEIPYQVALEFVGDDPEMSGQFCGGSLITQTAILTAAHCLDGLDPWDIQVRSGIISLNRSGQLRLAASFAIFPTWVPFDGSDDDVAIVFVTEPFILDDNTNVIEALSDDVGALTVAGTEAVVSGWGAPGEYSQRQPIWLNKRTVITIGDDACQTFVKQYDERINKNTMVCVDGQGGGACYGDSGGPLAARNSAGEPVLIGVVSWGIRCGFDEVSGMFAEVDRYQRWIAKTLANPPEAPVEPPPYVPGPKQRDIFTSGEAILVPADGSHGQGTESSITVEDIGRELLDVDVVLKGFSHQRPNDIVVVLVSPSGAQVGLFVFVGGTDRIRRVKLRFDDNATESITNNVTAGRYLPSSSDPAAPIDLASLEGDDPNGVWELLTFDEVTGKKGKIRDWKLIIRSH